MKGITAYRQNRVESASGAQLVKMLIEEVAKRLERGSADIERGGTGSDDFRHAREVLSELALALDDSQSPELCARLRSVYLWSMAEIGNAGRERDAAKARSVIRVITPLVEAWREVARLHP